MLRWAGPGAGRAGSVVAPAGVAFGLAAGLAVHLGRRSGPGRRCGLLEAVLADAEDIAAVLHHRVHCWTDAAAGRRPRPGSLIAGLIPRAQGVTDPELATGLAERDRAMEDRARTLAAQAVEAGQPWVGGLGSRPAELVRRQRWLREVSTVAAYRTAGSSPASVPSGPRRT